MTQNGTNDTRKPYAPPSVTELGGAVEKTKGMWGGGYETYGSIPWDIDPDDDDPPNNGGN